MVVVRPGASLRKLAFLHALRGSQVLRPQLKIGAGLGTDFGRCFPDNSSFVWHGGTGRVRQVGLGRLNHWTSGKAIACHFEVWAQGDGLQKAAWRGVPTLKNLKLLLAIVLLMWIPRESQGSASAQQTNGQAETAGQSRKQYQEKTEARLRELNRKIAALNASASKQAGEARKELDRQMAELDRKRKVARQQFERLENSSQEAWRDMEPGIDAAARDLEAAYKRAAADFNK